MAYDIQVIIQANLYFLIFALNFVVAIPLGVIVTELNDRCMLYSDITWIDPTHFRTTLSSSGTCHFPLYVAVACIFYSLLLGVYNMYVVCRSRDPRIGSQMWVLPLILLTVVIVIVMLIVSCILSVGIKYTCDGFLKMKDKIKDIHSCSDFDKFELRDAQDESLPHGSFRHFYGYLKISEVASWVTLLVWTIQASLFVFRFFRNRRSISESKAADPLPPDATQKSSDLTHFASVEPTA
ncbi:hypothetical protein BsWGS_10638 [Bradybaena similaris]